MNRNLHLGVIFIILLFCLTPFISYSSNTIQYLKEDQSSITKKSKNQDKFFFVNFSAQWCATCLIMEDANNANTELVHFVDKNLLAVKADVDENIGKKWMNDLGVMCLPTLVVFNSDGKELARKEGGTSSEELLYFLQQAIGKSTSIPIATNISYSEKSETLQAKGIADSKTDQQKKEIVKSNSTTWAVQVGIYKNLKNANKKIQKIRSQSSEPVYLVPLNDVSGLVYKVVIGDFQTMNFASNLNKKLSSSGIKGYVSML